MSYKSLDPLAPITMLTDRHRQSYATIGRLFRLSLEAIGMAVGDIDTPMDDGERAKVAKNLADQIVLHSTIGSDFRPIEEAFNIALPEHEWSRYPKKWVQHLNRFDEVWVPTDHIRVVLKNSGVEVPIYFLPPALEFDSPPQKTEWDFDGPIKFFSCGEPHFRKGFHLLMAGYMLAFPTVGEAELYIKTSPACSWETPREDIFIIAENLERESLLAMYKDFDVYITASLGEGVGLPVAEAIMARLPVSANFWGGHESLLKEGAFWQIDHEEVPQLFCSNPGFYADEQKCAFSSPQAIAEAIKKIVESTPPEREQMAGEAEKYILECYGNAPATKRFKKRFGVS